MLSRITDIIKNDRMVHNLNRHQMDLNKIENQLSTSKKIQNPSDDPSAATNQMYFRTRIEELDQFEMNIGEGRARLNLVDGELSSVTDILQRVRVLAVQASNGIYQGDNYFELKNAIATEIDQHLRSLIDIGNARDSTGLYLFGGHNTDAPPFQIVETTTQGFGGNTENEITDVRYLGNIGKQFREVERSQYIDVNLPGLQALWATNMTVTGAVDNAGYVSNSEQNFRIDGNEIQVSIGDTIDDVIEKINKANIEVKASKVGQDFISITTTSPHQIWLEDVGSGTLLKDVGLLSKDPLAIPNHYAEDSQVSGLSIFDTLIKLRNDLQSGDQLEIGGRDLGNIDEGLSNLLRHRAQVGARVNRLEQHEQRVTWDKTYMTELLSQNEGVDMPEAIMNLKWLESVHSYALNVGSRIIRPQLLDFIQ